MEKQVKPIDTFECKDWLLNKHYAKRMCSISYAFGLYIDSVLCGVCTFGSPPSRTLCIGICGEHNANRVIELNRLCVNEGLPKNTLSYFVSQCLNKLPSGKIIVSYADTSMNHHGYIYQATNWIYTGLTLARIERYDTSNPNKHHKNVVKSGQDYNDFAVRQRPQKHRYVYFTGSKTNKKHLRSSLNYKVKPYPKGDNKRYDTSYSPIVQSKLF